MREIHDPSEHVEGFCCKNFNLIKIKDVSRSLFRKNREKMPLFLQ